MTALQDRQELQEKQQIEAGEAWQESDMVFTTQLGSPVEPRKVHDARRAWASLLADLDVHPGVAMAILRHADFKVTDGDLHRSIFEGHNGSAQASRKEP